MAKAAILLLDNAYGSNIFGLLEVFQVALAHLRRQNPEAAPVFEWDLVSRRAGEALPLNTQVPLTPTAAITDKTRYDLIYVPALYYPGGTAFYEWLEQQTETAAWLREQWKNGAKLAATCTGTFMLAETGLLDDCQATTHLVAGESVPPPLPPRRSARRADDHGG